MEPEAEALVQDALRKNHIDHEEYPTAKAIEEASVLPSGPVGTAASYLPQRLHFLATARIVSPHHGHTFGLLGLARGSSPRQSAA
jgi:hypothetical protein